MEGEQVIQVGRLRDTEKFEGERENYMFNTFTYFKPVKRFDNMSGVSEFNNGTSKGFLDLLDKDIYLRLGKIVVQRVTVVKFGMRVGGCNDRYNCWHYYASI